MLSNTQFAMAVHVMTALAYNRGQVIPRLDRLFAMDAPLRRYVDYVREREAAGA